jgi:IMP dehydrogenase
VGVICVDVAHGHHKLVERAIKTIKDAYAEAIHIMAGNVATLQAFNDLSDWGADSVRCNIGGGSICSTRIQTGHGHPGLQTVFDCAATDRDAKIIADGGIRTSGDIVKALAAGADFVMLGSLLAGTEEAPGEKIARNGHVFKKYRGMASKDAQISWRGRYSSNEGVSAEVPFKGPVGDILDDLTNGVRSGLSYSGARSIKELQAKAMFVRQTAAGQGESRAHING